MNTPDPTTPIQLFSVTHSLDEQVSIFEELLGDPQALIAAAEKEHELIVAPPDLAALIHPDRGADRVQVGHTMEEVRVALGEPHDVTDFEAMGLEVGLEDCGFGVTWHYEPLGVEIEFQQGLVARLAFHSGTYRGGLIPRSWQRWEGDLAPDMSLETLSEEELEVRFGAPLNAYDCDPELAEVMDEEPVRRVIYAGWTFEFLLDGRLQSVMVPAATVSTPTAPPGETSPEDKEGGDTWST
ncbi:MAG: hypothetical protein JKY65_27180 [Planctomycetes bacterium]|nr:hypothetical protein [Planctomycetota bacterium]